MHKNVIVEVNNVSFEYPNGQKIFQKLNLSILNNSKIGLIGINGCGKTSLFKLILQELIPSNGHIKGYGNIGYVPQVMPGVFSSNESLEDYLVSKSEDYWNVYALLNELFELDYDIYSKMNQLSGGELMKINLAIALSESPDLLLLDEPTNHLDTSSIKKIIGLLQQTQTAFLVISHDIFFLDQVVNEIWEIDSQRIEVYGGNYTDYKQQKMLQVESRRKILEGAKNKLKHANALKQKELQRTARNGRNKRKEYLEGSLIKWEYTPGEKGKPSLSTAFMKKVNKIKTQAESDIEDNKMGIRKLPNINIKDTNKKEGQTLIRAQDFYIAFDSKIFINEVNLVISYGQRINITGKNGSGKTVLVKNLIRKHEHIYQKNNLKYLYIDQNYSLINYDKNLIENMLDFLPGIGEAECKKILGRMQFRDLADVKKPARDLSGGELARLALAIASALPIELLILDEPTNNLDVDTIDTMIESLNRYNGALIVISHNIDFLSKIRITSSYIIKDSKLKRMMSLPDQKDLYYKEVLEG